MSGSLALLADAQDHLAMAVGRLEAALEQENGAHLRLSLEHTLATLRNEQRRLERRISWGSRSPLTFHEDTQN